MRNVKETTWRERSWREKEREKLEKERVEKERLERERLEHVQKEKEERERREREDQVGKKAKDALLAALASKRIPFRVRHFLLYFLLARSLTLCHSRQDDQVPDVRQDL